MESALNSPTTQESMCQVLAYLTGLKRNCLLHYLFAKFPDSTMRMPFCIHISPTLACADATLVC